MRETGRIRTERNAKQKLACGLFLSASSMASFGAADAQNCGQTHGHLGNSRWLFKRINSGSIQRLFLLSFYSSFQKNDFCRPAPNPKIIFLNIREPFMDNSRFFYSLKAGAWAFRETVSTLIFRKYRLLSFSKSQRAIIRALALALYGNK